MRLTSVSSLLLVSVVYACSSGPPKDDVEGSESRVTSRPFDKNDVVDDTSLKDVSAMSESDVQKFLEKTPWGTRSVLADYQQGGKKASTIMYERATSHGINPLAMLVRVQMEQGLVSKKTATAATIEIAFGCGCPQKAHRRAAMGISLRHSVHFLVVGSSALFDRAIIAVYGTMTKK